MKLSKGLGQKQLKSKDFNVLMLGLKCIYLSCMYVKKSIGVNARKRNIFVFVWDKNIQIG